MAEEKKESNAGRPPLFDSPSLMQQSIDLYFKTCDAEKKQPTITRLCYELGFESRQSFYDYEEKPEFTYIIKRARLFVESGYEQNLQNQSCTGAIFALKNMGWKDKIEQDVSVSGTPIQIIMPPDEPIAE